ncbi:bifunctional 3'-5' exonuclease/DNA polymerase [Glaciibacter flavus]|uniref:DNA-directed DNA polymerase n=1 Tax=Orlajensenia flava TaxID=2565934 RepID=A0A4S4FX59_9MICO|nr:bifunctional 3'-5' exonuclease/DNA polymerase [Glaciibacter flavus]THG35144.1 bifunctional 3'-5' exonuclease/DNA polymerase [Glaciibacter flavus]
MFIVVGRAQSGLTAHRLNDDGSAAGDPERVGDLGAFVRSVETFPASEVRWVWDDTARWYPRLLEAGLRVARCHDLRLCHAILRDSARVNAPVEGGAGAWSSAEQADDASGAGDEALFDLGDDVGRDDLATDRLTETVDELRRQLAAITSADEPGGLRLLLAAESAGALIAAEMRFAGLPWSSAVHDTALTELLGPRVGPGVRPQRMEVLASAIRATLEDPLLNPDSPQDVLRALRRTGAMVDSTRAWELRELDHPVVPPLLEYKKLSRLLAANGWAWMDAWVRDGRFRAEYLPGGVVTGRWAARGGGVLQLPKQVRSAVRADPGWKLVVADAAQLEPRVLAGLSGDTAMASAGHGVDMYAGIVAAGAVDTRQHAKIAMLGAMYGATSGESARLMPRLARAYPRAIAYVETAARAGERGEVVTSRLGRSSPRPGEGWLKTQRQASDPDATPADERRARSSARDWGRFTRNFVVQSSAAEWALCWMAELRGALAAIPRTDASLGLAGTGFADAPHLVYFLHDEVIVHTPEEHADRVAAILEESARRAGRLLFGEFPVDFPLGIGVVDHYGEAKG